MRANGRCLARRDSKAGALESFLGGEAVRMRCGLQGKGRRTFRPSGACKGCWRRGVAAAGAACSAVLRTHHSAASWLASYSAEPPKARMLQSDKSLEHEAHSHAALAWARRLCAAGAAAAAVGPPGGGPSGRRPALPMACSLLDCIHERASIHKDKCQHSRGQQDVNT